MTIKIQRGRQFAVGDASVQVLDDKGKAGTYLQKAADKLVSQNISVVVRGPYNRKVTLATAEDWKGFLEKNCANKEQTAAFAKKTGITFGDFINAIDDAAASDDKGLTLDLRPTSTLGKALSLDKTDGDYGMKLAKDATVALTGANGATSTAQAAGVNVIGKEILAAPIASDWQRDRTEMENWADFKNGNTERDVFKTNTGPAPYAKLTAPKWDDPKAMELVNQFALPLHLETKGNNPDGTVKFQDGYEMFRDTYFDDKSGALDKAGASVRARVRFDNNEPFTVNRVLVQAKEGRAVSAGGNSEVHKFEKRWEGNSTNEESAKAQLTTGKEAGGGTLAVSAKLYKLANDKGTLPADGNLVLEEKYTVLQKRRRTHLQLDSVGEVQSRRTGLQTEMDALKAANKPIPPAMEAFGKKLDEQIKFLTDAGAALRKYNQYMPSGECFIISADQYSVYDPTARKGKPPTDPGDDVGRIGRGPLHLEAEWDSASSDPFEKALKEVDKRLAAATTPADKTSLEADKKALEGFRATFQKDVQATVEVVKKQLLALDLKEEPTKLSKEERAGALAAKTDRPVFWM
ncbi:MAG: hypothetical protein Q8L14_00710 [Myxococcales bacterium]|nr:hypothetical protein [Myxococcales bacterium]